MLGIDIVPKVPVPDKYDPHTRVRLLHYYVDRYECEEGCLHGYSKAKYPDIGYLLPKWIQEFRKEFPGADTWNACPKGGMHDWQHWFLWPLVKKHVCTKCRDKEDDFWVKTFSKGR